MDLKTLYAELKPSMETVSGPLFEFSKSCLRERGDFLPHALVLTTQGKTELVGASDGNNMSTAEMVLPILHGGIRTMAKQKSLAAIGIAESVTITPSGHASTRAIKVLFEHVRGLTVALYVPYQKKFLRGYVYGDMMSSLAKPEVDAWAG